MKTAGQLNAFLAENKLELTDEEKQTALEYIKTGVLPLGDEELENVAGGLCNASKGRPDVTFCKSCLHGLLGTYKRRGDIQGSPYLQTKTRTCFDGGEYNSRSNGWCEYCSNEKGRWYCNYPNKVLS